MSSTLFGRGTFLQTGHKQRQDALDRQLADLRAFAVVATEEIRTLKAKVAALEQAIKDPPIKGVVGAPLTLVTPPQTVVAPPAELSGPAPSGDAALESTQ